jgi:hypothetical protein
MLLAIALIAIRRFSRRIRRSPQAERGRLFGLGGQSEIPARLPPILAMKRLSHTRGENARLFKKT